MLKKSVRVRVVVAHSCGPVTELLPCLAFIYISDEFRHFRTAGGYELLISFQKFLQCYRRSREILRRGKLLLVQQSQLVEVELYLPPEFSCFALHSHRTAGNIPKLPVIQPFCRRRWVQFGIRPVKPDGIRPYLCLKRTGLVRHSHLEVGFSVFVIFLKKRGYNEYCLK